MGWICQLPTRAQKVFAVLYSEATHNTKRNMRGMWMAKRCYASTAKAARKTALEWVRPGSQDYLREVLESRVYDVATQTPLSFAPSLSKKLDARIFLKREDLQPTFSFNLRGAHNRIAKLTSAQRANGIVSCAAGNFMLGAAHSASKLGIDTVIVTPYGTSETKRPLLSKYNVNLIERGTNFDEAVKEAHRVAQKEGRYFVHPFDDPLVIAGHGTIAMEILRETAAELPDAVFVPVGGGGLLAGMAAYIKEVAPEVAVIGVEPSGANILQESLKAGERITMANPNRFTDDVGIRSVGVENFRICKQLVDDVITVSSDEICAAIRDVFGDTRALMEPIGAISVAGVKKYAPLHQKQQPNAKYVAVLAAANMDFDRLRFVSERSDDREHFMAVKIPEQRGSFQRLYNLIYPRNVTEFTYRLTCVEDKEACISMSIQTKTREEYDQVIKLINQTEGMQAEDLGANELAKSHLRHLAGGRAENVPNERLFRLEFPERPGALKDFLDALGASSSSCWNVSLFHYRNHGADIGRVLVAFQVPPAENQQFVQFLDSLGFNFIEETHNPAYTQFLL